MDFFEAINQRRSCRKFTADPIPTEVMNAALDAALKAPNSSNLQPWEFYWVQSAQKKSDVVKACFSQNAAATAQEIIVAVARIDTWKRNRDQLVELLQKNGPLPSPVLAYYNKIIPAAYITGPFSILSLLKTPLVALIGLFRPMPRYPSNRNELFELTTKTTALACENFMLAMSAQGFATCPMEGFDEVRVKKVLGLNRNAHVVMVIGTGKEAPGGVFGPRVRLDPKNFIFKV